jgi:two-component system, LytTR family, response regulator
VTVRVLLVDDEPPARRRLRALLGAEADVEVVGECATAAEAIAAVGRHRPDLLFLDVRMPEGDGFQVAEAVGDGGPLIVFVTAFGDHAVRAFDVRAVDYLTKPFTPQRLSEAVRRSRQALAAAHAVSPGAPAGATPLRRLPVDLGRRVRLVDTRDIEHLRAEGNYVRVHLDAGSYLVRATLTTLCARLDPTEFLRVHRSAAVRLDRVREVETLAHGELLLRLASGAAVITGRHYGPAVRAALGL